MDVNDFFSKATNQYLTFTLDGSWYALHVKFIKEILTVPKMTNVPRMVEYLNKVINLRGSIIPVLDLKNKFGIGNTEVTQETGIIVCDVPSLSFNDDGSMISIGLLSDSIEQVVDLAASAIEPPPRIGSPINTTFISGVGQLLDTFVIILDLEKIILEEENLSTSRIQEASDGSTDN